MIIALVIFEILAFAFLWAVCKLGKDPDGKEDKREYWEAFREQRWREDEERRKKSDN